MLDLAPLRPSASSAAVAGGPVVEAVALRKSYDARREVLAGVDLRVAQGERVALIGANGSGKSTLLRCLVGLHALSGGRVTTLGETFARRPGPAQERRLRAQVGFVFQKHCLVRRRTVLSNVVHGLLSQPGSWRGFAQSIAPGPWRVAAIEALGLVHLADKAGERADALSGGQQQRVAIARALVRRPALLIADEPAASLDPVAGRDVMALFSGLCRDHGITLVFTSHDMAHARDFADRIVALRGGRVVLDRPAAEVREADLGRVFDAADR